MKKLVGVTALAALFASGSAFAIDQEDLNVQAMVLGVCQINSITTMDFGNLDPLAPADTTANATIEFFCSAGSAYMFNDVSGPEVMTRDLGGPDTLAYDIAAYAMNGVVLDGNPQTLVLTGTVLAGAYAGIAAGAYSDVQVVTINP
ncbi:MAG: spore coat protein U domain-containing protein [Deltaproteobacteria bacterium]|nr:spore coat protein U domain-containing protein [Deltaproteobacteria bacterium]